MNDFKSNIGELTNFEELVNEVNKIRKIQLEIEKISKDVSMDSFLRKMKIDDLIKKITNIKSHIAKGIPIQCEELKNKITNDIVEYLRPYAYTKEFILLRLENIKFSITDERLLSGGLLSHTNKKINIDYSLAVFDEQGKFVKFKEEKADFLIYALTHEFLHALSFPSTNKSMTNDALSEGYTDLFAHTMSKNFTDKSDLYDFSVRVCTLLTNMIGIDKTLDDYINNLGEFSNLKEFFYNQGLDEIAFNEFYILMNNIIELQINKNSQLQSKKIELLEIIKNNLLIPFLKSNEVNQENYVNLFNNLFKEFGFICSLEEIKNIVK